MANKNATFPGPGPGRPPGMQNKLTVELRDMVRQALDQAGGIDYLARQAEENPGPFLALVGKVIPSELRITLSNPILTMDISDVARLAVAIGRERGLTIPSSLAKLVGEEAGNLPAIRQTKTISQSGEDAS